MKDEKQESTNPTYMLPSTHLLNNLIDVDEEEKTCRRTVYLRSLLESDAWRESNAAIPIPLGLDSWHLVNISEGEEKAYGRCSDFLNTCSGISVFELTSTMPSKKRKQTACLICIPVHLSVFYKV